MAEGSGRWRRRLLALGLGSLLFLGLVEVGLRWRQQAKYGTAFSYYHFEEDPESGLRIPVASETLGPIRINSRGFRGEEIADPKPEGRLRVGFLGGSTTFCAEVSSDAATWPALVVDALQEAYPEREFDFVNAGAGGYSTEQSSLNLAHRVGPLEPDVLVVYHATNDLTFDTRRLAVEQGLWEEDALELSWLSDYWLTWNLLEKNLVFRSRAESAGEAGSVLEFDAEALAAGFQANLERLLVECQEVAPVVLVATFSIQARRGQGEEELRAASQSSLYYMPYMSPEGLLDAFEAYNGAIRRAGESTGVILALGEDEIPGDKAHFNDSVHFKDPGAVLMAQRVAEALLADPGFQRLARGDGL